VDPRADKATFRTPLVKRVTLQAVYGNESTRGKALTKEEVSALTRQVFHAKDESTLISSTRAEAGRAQRQGTRATRREALHGVNPLPSSESRGREHLNTTFG
jgi:hypothetical protein